MRTTTGIRWPGRSLSVAAVACMVCVGVLATAGPALAADPSGAETLAESPHAPVDFVWIIIAAALVFIMQGGFAMLTAGLCRAKNVVNLMMKTLMDFAIGSLDGNGSRGPSLPATMIVGDVSLFYMTTMEEWAGCPNFGTGKPRTRPSWSSAGTCGATDRTSGFRPEASIRSSLS